MLVQGASRPSQRTLSVQRGRDLDQGTNRRASSGPSTCGGAGPVGGDEPLELQARVLESISPAAPRARSTLDLRRGLDRAPRQHDGKVPGGQHDAPSLAGPAERRGTRPTRGSTLAATRWGSR